MDNSVLNIQGQFVSMDVLLPTHCWMWHEPKTCLISVQQQCDLECITANSTWYNLDIITCLAALLTCYTFRKCISIKNKQTKLKIKQSMIFSVYLILQDNSSYYSQNWISNIDYKKNRHYRLFDWYRESNGEVKSTSPYSTCPASILRQKFPQFKYIPFLIQDIKEIC